MRMPIFFKYYRHHGGYVFESKERVLVPSNPHAEIEEGIFSELALYEFLDATLGDTYPQLTEAKVLSFSLVRPSTSQQCLLLADKTGEFTSGLVQLTR